MKNTDNKPWWRHIPGFRSGKRWRMVIAGFVYAFVAFFVLGSLLPGREKPVSTQPVASGQVEETAPKKPNLEVLNARFTSNGLLRYIEGTVRNNTQRTYGYVQVEINLYDKSGAQIGSTMSNANNLEPGAVWRFKALVTHDNVASFKVMEVTGF